MSRVVAQGTFDILHPGHVHYLQDARSMGDTLHVIVARQSNVTHKPDPVVPGPQRVEMVAALDPVDHARLGHPADIFVPIAGGTLSVGLGESRPTACGAAGTRAELRTARADGSHVRASVPAPYKGSEAAVRACRRADAYRSLKTGKRHRERYVYTQRYRGRRYRPRG